MTRMVWLLLLAAPVLADDALEARIDGLAAPYLESGRVTGMSIALLTKDGETLFAGYGPGAGPDAVYEIGSVSKVLNGVLLASLVKDGTVKLDQPLQSLLPEGVTVPRKGDRAITLADLATHASGLPRMPDNFAPKDLTDPYADYTVAQMYAFLNKHELRRAPGAEYEYSNYAAGLLGHVLGLAAKKDYEMLLRERITGPLGMKDTCIVLDDARKARLVPGHDAAGKPAGNWAFPTLAGAGGIRSTVTDMLAFLRANLEGDHPALALAREIRFRAPAGPVLGLGWHVGASGIHFHTGQTGGYHAYAAVDTVRKVAVVVLSNTATGEVDAFGESVLRLLLGVDEKPRVFRKEVVVAKEVLATYAGTYALAPTFKLAVTVEGGQLMVQATGQQKLPLYAESETKFFLKVVDAQLTFEKDAAGKVVAAVLHQGGRDMRAARE